MTTQSAQLPNMYFRRKIGTNQRELSMDAGMIQLLLAIDESKPISQVAKEAGIKPAQVKSALMKLLKLNLIEPVGKGFKPLPGGFIEKVRNELIRAIGPIGEFLIEDAAADMGSSLSEIPVQRAPELISLLAEQIPEETTRLEFKRTMISQLP